MRLHNNMQLFLFAAARVKGQSITVPYLAEKKVMKMNENNNYAGCLTEEPRCPLDTLNSEELMEIPYKRRAGAVDGLLRPGLAVLAGSPKIGKSWLVLHLCMQIAKGEPFWGLKTHQGDVLYIALEDSRERLQQRVNTITDEPSEHLHFATDCSPLGEELERELGAFVLAHPDTRLIVIDTFQRIRSDKQQLSYANDYAEVTHLKEIADAMDVCILLVHHTRKLTDSDRLNEISGTNGIAGSADTLMILNREKRGVRKATLTCTGRDIEDRELELTLDRATCRWQPTKPIVSSSLDVMPDEMAQLVTYMKRNKSYDGSNTRFAELLSAYIGKSINARWLKQMMNRWRYDLEDCGVSFLNFRTGSERRLLVVYSDPDATLPPAA